MTNEINTTIKLFGTFIENLLYEQKKYTKKWNGRNWKCFCTSKSILFKKYFGSSF